MNIAHILKPQPTISDNDLRYGLRMLTAEGIVSMALNSVTTSGLLAAFALALGANNFQIGIMASVGAIMQPLQIPAILLVERVRRRKALALLSWLPAQLIWVPIALIPIFVGVPSGPAVSLLLFFLAVRSGLSAITNCAWNSWIRDLVPQDILGRFFSRRLALSTGAAVVFGLAGAIFVDWWQGAAPAGQQVLGYTYILLFGAIFLGLASPAFMSRMPEPTMQPMIGRVPSLREMLSTPFKDSNFRQLMNFLFLWGFAANLAIPFFAVYMLQVLQFPLTAVIALTTLSQLSNILFLRVWGPFADRYGSKVVLYTNVSLYLLVILGFTFTTMPDPYFLTVPLVIVLHVFAGIAAAGVNLTVGTIGLKLAPQGQATPYMASASLAVNLGAGVGPLVGGRFIDFFSQRALTLSFAWESPGRTLEFPAISLTGFDFLFTIAFLVGLVTLNTLATVKEQGEVSRDVLLDELVAPTREMTRAMEFVPGLRVLGAFPYGYLRHVPGLDVAVGVTAYQIAASTKAAVSTMSRGRDVALEVAERVGGVLGQVTGRALNIGQYGVELAKHATRGAMNAADGFTSQGPPPYQRGVREGERSDVGSLARGAVLGTLTALRRTAVDPLDALRGAVQGVIEGAMEAGSDVGRAAAAAVEAAREAARRIGLSPQEAAARAAESAVEAAAAISPEAAAEVREALSQETSDQEPQAHRE